MDMEDTTSLILGTNRHRLSASFRQGSTIANSVMVLGITFSDHQEDDTDNIWKLRVAGID